MFVIDRLRRFGSMRAGWIGVKIQQITPEMATALGMTAPMGSVVAALEPDGPAAKAGVRIGDVILSFGHKTPGDERALLRQIVESSTGEQVPITVLRDGKPLTLLVTVGSFPKAVENGPLMSRRPGFIIPPELGLSLAALSRETRTRYGLPLDQPGVLISGVAANTDAADRGLAAGDVILRVNKVVADSPASVRRVFDEIRAQHHTMAMLLVLPKVVPRTTPKWAGPKWVPIRVASD
jgi:serine protease Do